MYLEKKNSLKCFGESPDVLKFIETSSAVLFEKKKLNWLHFSIFNNNTKNLHLRAGRAPFITLSENDEDGEK